MVQILKWWYRIRAHFRDLGVPGEGEKGENQREVSVCSVCVWREKVVEEGGGEKWRKQEKETDVNA